MNVRALWRKRNFLYQDYAARLGLDFDADYVIEEDCYEIILKRDGKWHNIFYVKLDEFLNKKYMLSLIH